MAKARKVSRRKNKAERFDVELEKNNVIAITQGPRRKNWSVLDIKPIKPMRPPQASMIESYYMDNHVVATGSAGTGKTFIAMWLALNTIFSKDTPQDHIRLVRSAVPSREIGFLKGSNEEKLAVYETPYFDMLKDLMGKPSSYEDLKEAGKIIFTPTSFVRGSTWDNAVVIIDEAQNMTIDEINSVMTRVGVNTKVIVCGDAKQNDLVGKRTAEQSGYKDFLRIAEAMSEMDIVVFTRDDIVRSAFVKSWITAKEDLNL